MGLVYILGLFGVKRGESFSPASSFSFTVSYIHGYYIILLYHTLVSAC